MKKNKKQRREEKRIRILTHKLLQKYPFLEFKPWDRDKYKYTFYREYNKKKRRFIKKRLVYLYPFDDGWMKLFYYPMMDEIKASLERSGCMDSFGIDQYKEKFGEMRFYVYGCADETYKIIDKYTMISNNVCHTCGRPDVGYTDGWIIPICKKCYDKNKYYTRPYEDVISDDNTIRNSYSITRYLPNQEKQTIEYDISDTVNMLRRRWRRKHED